MMQTEVHEQQEVSTPSLAGTATSTLPPAGMRRRRRQRYWVDWTSQLPVTALGLLATLFFLVMFNVTLRDLSASRREQITSAAPDLAEQLQVQDRSFHRSIAVLSGIFFVCVGVGMVVLTQRSAGPIARICTHLQRAARGDLEHRVSLRRRDHFQPLAESCNTLFEALQRERHQDAARLEQLAAAAETATSPAALHKLAAELRSCAHSKR